MNSIQIADETFIAADPADVGAAVADQASWLRWWPDLRLTVVEDRGEVGQRWTVTGTLTGTMEVWLERMMDGVVLHYFPACRAGRCRSLGVGQDEPAGDEPPAPGRRKGHGVRGQAQTGGQPAGGGVPTGVKCGGRTSSTE